jgi:hypothetical protein
MRKLGWKLMFVLLFVSFALGAWTDRNDPGDYNCIVDIGTNGWDKEIYVYQNQTNIIYFQRSIGGLIAGRIRINGGSWSNYVTNTNTLTFNTTNLFSVLGEYTLELNIIWQDESITTTIFKVFSVKSRYEYYYDENGNSMSHWNGGSNPTDRPALIAEGFDPSNLNRPALYYYGASNFMDGMLDRDADIFILNFDDGGADMVQNAQVVIEALNYIETLRSGEQKMILCGVSMGGVIARYAAVQAEVSGNPLDISHFISIDSPQQGAVIHDDFQDYVDSHDDDSPEHGLNCIAAKQLLQYNTYNESHSYHDSFYNTLRAMNSNYGYPENTVNLGVTFSPNTPNPNSGVWMEINPGSTEFSFNSSDDVSQAGSWLPVTTGETEGWTYLPNPSINPFIPLYYEIVRTDEHPTFIPYESALDINTATGESRFDITIASATHGFHDKFPTGLDTDGLNMVTHILDIIDLDPSSLINVTLTNRNTSGTNILGGLHVDYSQPVSSGGTIELIANTEYIVNTDAQKISYLSQDYQHHHWNNLPVYKISHNFRAWENNGIENAIFKEFSEVTINPIAQGNIQLHDPWFISNPDAENPADWIQPNSFQPVSGSYDVFLNQEYDPNNPDLPIYSLKAPRYYADTEHIYELNGWVANPAADADFFSTEDPTVYNVVFKDESVTVSPHYEPISSSPGEDISLSQGDILTIPGGAAISCSEGFRIVMKGGSLTGIPNEDGQLPILTSAEPLIDQGFTISGGWGGLSIESDDESIVTHVHIQNAKDAISLSGENTEVNLTVDHCIFHNCRNVTWNMWQDVTVHFQNNTFYNDNAECGFYFSGDINSEHVFFINDCIFENIEFIENLFFQGSARRNYFYSCTNVNTSFFHTWNNTISSNNPGFVDGANGNFRLQWDSPCIDQDYYFSDPDGTDGDIGAYYCPLETISGTVSGDYYGRFFTGGDLTVSAGFTFSLAPGSHITLGSGHDIRVYGTLHLDGTANAPIVFDKASGITRWGTLYFYGGSSGIVDHCEINDAYRIYIQNNPSVSITNNTLNSVYYGIYNYYSNPTISSNTITGPAYSGIYNYHSSPSIYNNNIYNCTRGIYTTGSASSPSLSRNHIEGSTYGLYASSSSSPQMTTERDNAEMFSDADNRVNNYFYYNVVGLYVSYNSNPDAGTYFEIPELCMGGFNYFNTSPDGHIDNDNSAMIKAEVNWWASGPIYGNVDSSPNAINETGGGPGSLPKSVSSSPEYLAYTQAHIAELLEDYESAIAQYAALVNGADTAVAIASLQGLQRSFLKADNNQGFQELMESMTLSNPILAAAARHYLANSYSIDRNLASAAVRYNDARAIS